jgi:hypothetical protein
MKIKRAEMKSINVSQRKVVFGIYAESKQAVVHIDAGLKKRLQELTLKCYGTKRLATYQPVLDSTIKHLIKSLESELGQKKGQKSDSSRKSSLNKMSENSAGLV